MHLFPYLYLYISLAGSVLLMVRNQQPSNRIGGRGLNSLICIKVTEPPKDSFSARLSRWGRFMWGSASLTVFHTALLRRVGIEEWRVPSPSPCSRRSSDQLDLMVDGLPVSLPSYEEAVYGSWGQRIPPCSAPGPTQLLLSQEAPGYRPPPLGNQPDGSHQPLLSTHSPEIPPPPYEEVQPSRPGDRTGDDKDTWLWRRGDRTPANELLRFHSDGDDQRAVHTEGWLF